MGWDRGDVQRTQPADPVNPASGGRACTTFLVPRLEGGGPHSGQPQAMANPVQSGRCLPLTSIPEMKPRTLHEPTRALVGKGARVWPSRNKSQELPEPTRTVRGPPPRALSPGPARSKPIASQSRFSEGTFCSCVVKDSTDVQMYRTVDVCIWRQRRKASQCALAMRKPHHTTPHTNPHHTLHHTPHPKEKENSTFSSHGPSRCECAA